MIVRRMIRTESNSGSSDNSVLLVSQGICAIVLGHYKASLWAIAIGACRSEFVDWTELGNAVITPPMIYP